MAVACSFPFNSTTAVFVVVVTILVIHSPLSAAASDLPVDPSVSSIATLDLYSEPALSEYKCRVTVSDCSVVGDAKEDDEMEFPTDSETNRRMLAAAWYISYSALWRNVVPCSRRGESYYNCHSSARANPYTRGCSRITRCRG